MPEPKTAILARGRQCIHRCYMTGQTCVYLRDLLETKSTGLFVLSPFSENFNYLYDYYLRGLPMPDWGHHGHVRRADTIGRTGYVMCSRICYPIQQSAGIVAEVTTPNLNVFYELGLACALKKRILVLAHSSATPPEVISFIEHVGLGGHLTRYGSDDTPISENVLERCKTFSRFKSQNVPQASPPNGVPVFSNELKPYLNIDDKDTIFPRESKISAIVRRVLENLGESAVSRIIERARIMLDSKGLSETGSVLSEHDIEDYIASLKENVYCVHQGDGTRPMPQAIHEAAFTLIDTTLADFETYFWLGVCHGLERQVVPLSILDSRITEIDLPFDVRTLWHVFGSFAESKIIEAQVGQILEEIIASAVSSAFVASRESFWHGIVQTHELLCYLGTEQSSQLQSKQVVGEWDLRTFQEISSFAKRSNTNLETKIVKPAFKKHHYEASDITGFHSLLAERVGRNHCIVVGTPDVNPVAEMALSILKGISPFRGWFSSELCVTDDTLVRLKSENLPETLMNVLSKLVGSRFQKPQDFRSSLEQQVGGQLTSRYSSTILKYAWTGSQTAPYPKYTGELERILESYVPFKYHDYGYYEPRPSSFFYQFNKKKPLRGFLYYGPDGSCSSRHEKEYIPREQFLPNPEQRDYRTWQLLGHLIVAPNPFDPLYPNSSFKVVLLMGVGGPATLGLAHILTGRLPDCRYKQWDNDKVKRFIQDSERFVRKLDDLIGAHGAAEAIIGIDVLNDIFSLNNDYEDSREIHDIRVEPNLSGVENPKAFRYVRTPLARVTNPAV